MQIVIAGGGLVGVSTAIALAQSGHTITLIEAREQFATSPRAIALSLASVNFLKTLHAWPDNTCPMKAIHVSERGQFGVTRLSAQEFGYEALGYVVRANVLLDAMVSAAKTYPCIQVRHGLTLVAAAASPCTLTVRDRHAIESTLAPDLLIVAEGMSSPTRALLDVDCNYRDHDMNAIVGEVTVGKPLGFVAYERFTDEGPLAMLPLDSQRYAFVCTMSRDKALLIEQLSDAEFLANLNTQFGTRLGRLSELSLRATYPLVEMLAKTQVKNQAVLLGSAAHHFHPAAGQGLNLSLRDAAHLADSLHAVAKDHLITVLQDYESRRLAEQHQVVGTTNRLVELFAPSARWLRPWRGLGLFAFDLSAPLKNFLVERASGFFPDIPLNCCEPK